jgi:hypothetical protein
MTELPSDETKLCPFCNELIKTEAIKCKHCHSDLESSSDSRQINIYNTINTKTSERSKPYSYFVTPSLPHEDIKKTGHGLASIALSLILFLVAITPYEDGSNEDPETLIIIFLFYYILLAIYSIWILLQPLSNKILPIISLIMTIFFMIIISNYNPS